LEFSWLSLCSCLVWTWEEGPCATRSFTELPVPGARYLVGKCRFVCVRAFNALVLYLARARRPVIASTGVAGAERASGTGLAKRVRSIPQASIEHGLILMFHAKVRIYHLRAAFD
jgi:hypothetical protein